jgi:hypothetical protein
MASAPVVEILVDLVRSGTKVTPEGDRLRFKPRLTADLRARIEQHKPELVHLIAGSGTERRTDKTATGAAPLSVPSVRHQGRSVPPDGCRFCRGREFILLENEPEWICPRCHPPPAGTAIVARWREPEASVPAAKPVKTSEMFDTREVDDVA